MTNKTKKQMNTAEMKKAKGGLISVAIITKRTDKLGTDDGSRYGNAREANITADQKTIIGG